MAIDIIGTITQVVDNSDPENVVIEGLDGFHVNTIGETIDGAGAYVLSEQTAQAKQEAGDADWESWLPPSSPSRLFAGRAASEHTFYRFPDEAGFREFVPEPEEASE